MDVHEKENLIEKSCFTRRIREFLWPLMKISAFPELCTNREGTNLAYSDKLTQIWVDSFICATFNNSTVGIEYAVSNAGGIHGRCSYLPWSSFPT